MSTENLRATADRLVAGCRERREMQGLDALYAPDAVSVEAMAAPGGDSAEIRGVEAIKGKHVWWDENFEVHDQKVEGPYLHGADRFAVIFGLDTTNKATGERSQMQEVGIYTVDDAGKITREEFFYTT